MYYFQLFKYLYSKYLCIYKNPGNMSSHYISRDNQNIHDDEKIKTAENSEIRWI
jgi:hypothetical protein